MHHPAPQPCILQPRMACLIGLSTLLSLAGCGGGGGGAGGGGGPVVVTPDPEPVLANVDDASAVSFVMAEVHDLEVDLTTAGFPIDGQTFVRVYRCDDDGSEHLVAIKRLRAGMTTTRIRVVIPGGISRDCLRVEVYGPATIEQGAPAPTAAS